MAGTRNRSILKLGEGLESHVTTPRQLTYYGSAPREHWTEPAKFAEDLQDQHVLEEESFSQVRLLDPEDLSLRKEIAEGGQAHVFLAGCEKFSTPGVVKRLKGGKVDLSQLRRRMDKVMEIVRKNSSAICRVMAVGEDNMGNGWILMERMGGDLRNLIDHVQYVGYVEDGQMHYVNDPQMPFEYSDTIKMMIDIARGMEDLHSCGLIHRDLKASNVLVTPLSLNSCLGEVIGLKESLESLYFYVKIGDYESSELIDGTGFWRPPEVLQALKDRNKPVWSRKGDVYSFGMLCYELLTRLCPFQDVQDKCRSMDDRVLGVLGGERPKLPAHVTSRMRDLLDLCWQTEPQKRPGWKAIVKSLEDEFKSHLPSVRNPHLYRCLEKVEEPSMESGPDSADQKIGSPSTGSPATSAEFCPDIEHQRAESSSTRVLEMQGPRTGHTTYHELRIISEEMPEPNPDSFMRLWYKVVSMYGNEVAQRVITEHKEIHFPRFLIVSMMRNLIEVLKKHALGKLAIIWDEVGAKTVIISLEEQIAFQEKCASGKVVVLWEADAKRDITIKALWEELNNILMKLENMDMTIHSRIHEFIIAFDAAVKQDIALECSVAQSPEALEVWKAVMKHNFTGRYQIWDVLLPLPGCSTLYPANDTANIYEDLARKDLVDLHVCTHNVKEYAITHLSGGYRRLLQKPIDLEWKILKYSDVTKPLAKTDLDELLCASEAHLNSVETNTVQNGCLAPKSLDTLEVKSVREPADSEQATASSVLVVGNLGASHMDGTKASELILNDRPSSTKINQEEPCKHVGEPADSAGVLISPSPLEGCSEGVHTAVRLSFTLPASCYATMAIRELLKMSTSVAFHKTLNNDPTK